MLFCKDCDCDCDCKDCNCAESGRCECNTNCNCQCNCGDDDEAGCRIDDEADACWRDEEATCYDLVMDYNVTDFSFSNNILNIANPTDDWYSFIDIENPTDVPYSLISFDYSNFDFISPVELNENANFVIKTTSHKIRDIYSNINFTDGFTVYNVQYDSNRLLLSCGSDGVLVYDWSEQNVDVPPALIAHITSSYAYRAKIYEESKLMISTTNGIEVYYIGG